MGIREELKQMQAVGAASFAIGLLDGIELVVMISKAAFWIGAAGLIWSLWGIADGFQ